MPIEMTGMGNLYQDLESILNGLSKKSIEKGLEAGAKIIAAKIKETAPVGKTHNLKDAVGVGRVKSTSRGRSITVGIHRKDFASQVYYPAYVEYGHGGPHPAGAQPFVRPSFDATKDDAYSAMRDTLREESNNTNNTKG